MSWWACDTQTNESLSLFASYRKETPRYGYTRYRLHIPNLGLVDAYLISFEPEEKDEDVHEWVVHPHLLHVLDSTLCGASITRYLLRHCSLHTHIKKFFLRSESNASSVLEARASANSSSSRFSFRSIYTLTRSGLLRLSKTPRYLGMKNWMKQVLFPCLDLLSKQIETNPHAREGYLLSHELCPRPPLPSKGLSRSKHDPSNNYSLSQTSSSVANHVRHDEKPSGTNTSLSFSSNLFPLCFHPFSSLFDFETCPLSETNLLCETSDVSPLFPLAPSCLLNETQHGPSSRKRKWEEPERDDACGKKKNPCRWEDFLV